MGKEYDIVKDLGYANWMDETAGLAVLLGYSLRDSMLEIRGAELAELLRGTRYDSDSYFKVEALAKSLSEEIERRISDREKFVYLDSFVPEILVKTGKDYVFEMIKNGDEFQIKISLYEFREDRELDEKIVRRAEKIAEGLCFQGKENISMPDTVTLRGSDKLRFRTVSHVDEGGKLLSEEIVHDHANGGTRGYTKKYFFGDFKTAFKAWRTIRETFTSDQKK